MTASGAHSLAAGQALPQEQTCLRDGAKVQSQPRTGRHHQNAKSRPLGELVVGIGTISILGYLVLQPLMAFRLSGVWRIAALVPLIAVVPVIAHAAYAFTQGSNIWPLGLIFFMPFAFLYLLVIAATRWLAGRRVRPRRAAQ